MLRNITLSADDILIQKAREKAKKEHITLNELFRKWLKKYVNTENPEIYYAEIMNKLDYVHSGKKFTRDELNAR